MVTPSGFSPCWERVWAGRRGGVVEKKFIFLIEVRTVTQMNEPQFYLIKINNKN